MKVQAIKTYTPLATNRLAQNSNLHKNHVSFGFGEDYGDDSFLLESPRKEDGNLIEYITCIVLFPVAFIQDYIRDKIIENGTYVEKPRLLGDESEDICL